MQIGLSIRLGDLRMVMIIVKEVLPKCIVRRGSGLWHPWLYRPDLYCKWFLLLNFVEGYICVWCVRSNPSWCFDFCFSASVLLFIDSASLFYCVLLRPYLLTHVNIVQYPKFKYEYLHKIAWSFSPTEILSKVWRVGVVPKGGDRVCISGTNLWAEIGYRSDTLFERSLEKERKRRLSEFLVVD